MDVVVTVPKNFKHPEALDKRGLAAWLAEGDPPGQDSGQLWAFACSGPEPKINPGERVYVCCEGMLVGFAHLVELSWQGKGSGWPKPKGFARWSLIRGGNAVACTIDEKIIGFRGWRYRWWSREAEKPLDLSPWLI